MEHEIATFLLESGRQFIRVRDLTKFQDKIARDAIPTAVRRLFQWCKDLWPEDRILVQTVAQTASSYFLIFLTSKKVIHESLLPLLMREAIHVATKFLGIPFPQNSFEVKDQLSHDNQPLLEKILVVRLNWELNILTVNDIQHILLEHATDLNAKEMIRVSQQFVEDCYCDRLSISKGPLVVALASVYDSLVKTESLTHWKSFKARFSPVFGKRLLKAGESIRARHQGRVVEEF